MDKRNRKKKTVDDTVCEIHKFNGYAVLSNCFVRSTNLSWSAIGLLARVMDFPHEWNFSKAGLIAICPDGETAIDTALSELKEWGYLEIKTLMPNESSTGRIQPIYSFYEYSARDTSIPQYDYELETFMVENAVLNRVKKTDNYTMISSKLLRNKEIPNKLLGFLLKVLSLPDYWHFSMSGLKAICKEGKTAVHKPQRKTAVRAKRANIRRSTLNIMLRSVRKISTPVLSLSTQQGRSWQSCKSRISRILR